MTEIEWLACTEPVRLLKAARSRFKHRKLRLFAVACCRCIWNSLTDERSRRAVDIAEAFADGRVSEDELRIAADGARLAHDESFRLRGKQGSCLEWAAEFAAQSFAWHAAENVSWMSATARGPDRATEASYPRQAELIRDLLGNPYRSVAFDPAWLSWHDGTVVKIAEAIYEGRDFDRLPILGDALEDAGCDNADILNHCRGPGPHVRGCWVVDAILGKS